MNFVCNENIPFKRLRQNNTPQKVRWRRAIDILLFFYNVEKIENKMQSRINKHEKENKEMFFF